MTNQNKILHIANNEECPHSKFVYEYIDYDSKEEAIEFYLKAAKVGLVGWDVAITPNGQVMTEENNRPGHDIYQSKIHLNSDGTVLKQFFDSIIYKK